MNPIEIKLQTTRVAKRNKVGQRASSDWWESELGIWVGRVLDCISGLVNRWFAIGGIELLSE
jgi:hypothetical protein